MGTSIHFHPVKFWRKLLPLFVKTLVCLIAAMTVSNISYAQTYESTLRAAEQGDAQAQLRLGIMYDTGEGVPESDINAYVWMSLSAAQGDEDAKRFKNLVAIEMTREQISEAQSLVQKCLENDYKGCD